MYRLTIYQADNNHAYIVADCETEKEVLLCLDSYKRTRDTSKFINYDIIYYDKLLDEKFDLEHIHF